MRAAFICETPGNVERVYAKGRKERLTSLASLHPTVLARESLRTEAPALKDIEALFSTWGMPALTDDEISLLPSLKAVFYAAGSVKSFARPFLERGVIVSSAWSANAIPVAEFAFAQIILSCKGYFRNTRESSDPEMRNSGKCFAGRGAFGESVGLIGCGMIARRLIGLLKNCELRILVCDPYLSDEEAGTLGVEKASLERMFSECYAVSNHLPNLPSLEGVLNGRLFASMREDATFINTGRGAQVNEAEMVEVLKRRPDISALLDVTWPEPPHQDSPLYTLPNVRLSSHIAGSLNDEIVRMADYVIEDFESWLADKPLKRQVTLEALERMA